MFTSAVIVIGAVVAVVVLGEVMVVVLVRGSTDEYVIDACLGRIRQTSPDAIERGVLQV